MPKYCSFWWLLDDEKGFFVCRFYVFRAVFRSFLNIGFVFFVYGFCIFRVLVFAFSVCRECLMSAVIRCFACICRHRMYERQDSSRRLGIGKV